MPCDICGRSTCATPTFCAASRAADQRKPRGKKPAGPHPDPNGGGAQESTAKERPKPRYDWRTNERNFKGLHTMRFDPLKFLVPGLIPAEGVTVISSKPKVGKSWLLLDLAISATMDRSTLGELKVAQGYVLHLALEDSDRRLQNRGTKLLPTFTGEWPESLRYFTKWRRVDEGGLDDTREWVEETRQKGHRISFVSIDVLQMIRPRRTRAGQTAYERDYEAIEGLRQLANELHVAILISTHNRKGGSDDLLDLVSGTLGLSGAADTIIVIERQGHGFVFDVRGRDIEGDTLAAEFNKNTCRWALLGDAAVMRMSRERQAILTALEDAEPEPLGPSAISTASGVKADSVRHLLRKLETDGLVRKDQKAGYGKWRRCEHPVHSVHTSVHSDHNPLM
jgi:AAA domain